MRKLMVFCGFVALVCGCDFFGSQQKRADTIRLEQQQAERIATEKKDNASALKAYIEGKCKLVEDEYRNVTNKIAGIDADAAKLEKVLSLIMEGDETAELGYEVRLLRVLKDETVNELAQRYLSMGFSVQRESFIARVKDIRAKEKEYRDALKNSDASFNAMIGDSTEWVATSRKNRDEEMRRLQREIADLEKKRDKALSGLRGTKSQEHDREAKAIDYGKEIDRKRGRFDLLRNPVVSRKIEERTSAERQSTYDRARITKQREIEDIDKRLKPKVGVLQVSKEVEGQTITRLCSEIKGRKDKLIDRSVALGKQVMIAKELMLEVPVCEAEDLKRLRVRVDKSLMLDKTK